MDRKLRIDLIKVFVKHELIPKKYLGKGKVITDKGLRLDLLNLFVKHNILSENYLRDEEVILKYKELRSAGMKGKDARMKLANENFTTIKTIEHILYGKKNEH